MRTLIRWISYVLLGVLAVLLAPTLIFAILFAFCVVSSVCLIVILVIVTASAIHDSWRSSRFGALYLLKLLKKL